MMAVSTPGSEGTPDDPDLANGTEESGSSGVPCEPGVIGAD
jgi:hypothetical protein